MRRPNLLFLYTDEQAAKTMSAYGNDHIETPNLDRLADGSIVFENTYVTQPVCTPSRSSLLTGLYPHSSGCTANNVPLPQDVECLPELADFSDYRTAHMGKWHLGDEIFAQHGFDEWVSIEDGYRQYY
ncbi:MAG: sulfatase family protein, partial [Armatimonadota bacterium]